MGSTPKASPSKGKAVKAGPNAGPAKSGTKFLKRELPDSEKIRLAKKSLEINPDTGFFWTIKDIAVNVGRDPAVVSRAISAAFRKPLVRVEVTEVAEPKRNEQLERQLRARFPEEVYYWLQNIRVIDCVSALQDSRPDEPRYGDLVHRCLGSALARELAEGVLWKHRNKILGLGSGRSVFYTLDALSRYPKLNWGNTTLVSLSGQVLARDHAGQIGSNLDADFHVNYLALRLSTAGNARVQTIQVGKSIADLTGDLKATLIWQQWQQMRPNYAIVGVGTLSPGHQFFEAIEKKEVVTEQKGTIQYQLGPIRNELGSLIELCKRSSVGDMGYCPVGDVCNFLFYIPAPDGMISEGDEVDIRKLIKNINDKLLTFTLPQFSEIENTVVLAGTKLKASAVLELIENRDAQYARLNIEVLYVDEAAARSILDLADRYPRKAI
jgi:DNA-binding transcriptional regulator LsrR (DeoR family)